MKKIITISMFGMLSLLLALPLVRAEKSEAAGTGMTGTPPEFADLEKTMKKDRADDLERRIAALEQANRFLSDRVQDVERSLYDFKARQ